jgi:hypothetical protein
MKCFQSVKVSSGMADFGKPKTYEKLKRERLDQLDNDLIDEYNIESDKEQEGQ